MKNETPFAIGYINVGRAKARDIVRAALTLELDAWGGGECSDRPDVYSLARESGFHVAAPVDRPGGKATPIFWRAGGRFTDAAPFSRLLAVGGDIGPGTGPDHGKPKYLVGVRLRDQASGRVVVPATCHLYAGQDWHPRPNMRATVSRGMLDNALALQSRRHGIPFLALDSNAAPDSPTWRVLAGRPRWTTNHRALEPITTHGEHWKPDAIAWRSDNRFVVDDQGVVDVGSDHGLLWLEGRLRHVRGM